MMRRPWASQCLARCALWGLAARGVAARTTAPAWFCVGGRPGSCTSAMGGERRVSGPMAGIGRVVVVLAAPDEIAVEVDRRDADRPAMLRCEWAHLRVQGSAVLVVGNVSPGLGEVGPQIPRSRVLVLRYPRDCDGGAGTVHGPTVPVGRCRGEPASGRCGEGGIRCVGATPEVRGEPFALHALVPWVQRRRPAKLLVQRASVQVVGGLD